jgi:hypothetical protein
MMPSSTSPSTNNSSKLMQSRWPPALSVVRSTLASNSSSSLAGPLGGSLKVPAATLAEISDQLCVDGSVLLQATEWAINKHACASGG